MLGFRTGRESFRSHTLLSFRYNTRLRKEFKFVDELNSHACQTAVERVLKAVNRFYDNCKKQVKGKKGYPKFKKNTRSVEYKVSGWKLSVQLSPRNTDQPLTPSQKAVGIDLGIKYFLADSQV